MQYEQMTDEQVILLAKTNEGAAEFLLQKYKNFVRGKARSYFLVGADNEDIVQEGMIGLYKAIRDYDPNKNASFRAFAELCITRQMITAIKMATRMKHQPLNSYVSLNQPVGTDAPERTLVDILEASKVSNPEEIMIDKEGYEKIGAEIDSALSAFEKKVLSLYLRGMSYSEMAKILGRHEKAIDNALQRAKNKINKFL